ncbi:MAG: hypothetical protein OXE92_09835 [Bacteroidetes bacterium]|nr:hypothetical protein [Bacteroidota bacterium]MCY4206008.1 hypothetical protein [Bacteroidota bacterium]
MLRYVKFRYVFAILFAFSATANALAQIQFRSDEYGRLIVNERIIDERNLSENLRTLPLLPPPYRGFSTYADGSFPMRVEINDVTYEVWGDRVIESCKVGRVNAYIRLTPDMITMSHDHRYRTVSGLQNDPPFLVSSFKGDGEETELYVHYGIPLESNFDRLNEVIHEKANVKIFLTSDRDKVLTEHSLDIDSVSANQVSTFPDRDLWVDTQQLRVQPGAHELLIASKTVTGQTLAVLYREITVSNYNKTGLRLSSVLLAYSVEQSQNDVSVSPKEIVRKDFSILPAPRNIYSTEWPVYLYFEIYGLTLNDQGRTNYDVEITLESKSKQKTRRGVRRFVRRVFKGRASTGESVTVSYKGDGIQSEESLYQILDVSKQKPGRYKLKVLVRDNETGQESGRSEDLLLVRWGLSCSE